MAETPSVKKYYDYAQQQVDEQAILDRFNAATVAQFNAQREANRQAENQFYNQMYNTQKTAMDTIRQANAAAVASGASRGVQAAQELSSLLGLQEESVASATELAQANRQTAAEETAAVLENVLNAYSQASQERAQLVSQGIEAASVDVQREANEAANIQAAAQQQQTTTEQARLFAEAAENGIDTYLAALQQAGKDYSQGDSTPESQASLNTALNSIGRTKEGNVLDFVKEDWKGNNSAANKAEQIIKSIDTIFAVYGIDKAAYQEQLDDLQKVASNEKVSWIGSFGDADEIFNKYGLGDAYATANYAEHVHDLYQQILNNIRNDYATNKNRKSKTA